jgi:hypothetical protein
MLAEGYLRRRYEAGLKAGEERGVAQAWEVWQAWNHRRLAAEKASQPFNEPTPTLNNPS